MKIRITDISREGRDLDFDFPADALNERLRAAKSDRLEYVFRSPLHAALRLELEGSMVSISGSASGEFSTQCARCAEEAVQKVSVPVEMILKLKSGKVADDIDSEDVQFGTHDGKEVDCAPIVEEALVLALPYSVLCRSDCRGLCPMCGTNLNQSDCGCASKVSGTEGFKALQQLKVH